MSKYYPELIQISKGLYHQYTAPIFIKDHFKIYDSSIHKAIMNHTTGNDKSLYGMILFIADKCEPDRKYDTYEFLKQTYTNLYRGYKLVYDNYIEYLREQKYERI